MAAEDEKSVEGPGTLDVVKFTHKTLKIAATANNDENTLSIEALNNASYQQYKNVFNANDKTFNGRKPSLILNMFKTLSTGEDQSDITITTAIDDNDDALIIQLTLNTKYDDTKFEFKLKPVSQDIASVLRLIAAMQNENKALSKNNEELQQRIVTL